MTLPGHEPSLYRRLRAAGCEMDHHESDLYVRSTSEASAIIAAYEASGGITNKSAFRSAVDGLPWLELPFHYEPHWARDAGLLSTDVDLSEWAYIGTAGDYAVWRSEEHTSELQSLMRISYAVFCLTKKNTPQKATQPNE